MIIDRSLSSSTTVSGIEQVSRALQDLNGQTHSYDAMDFIVKSDRNEFLIREDRQGLEVRICLQDKILDEVSSLQLPRDLNLAKLGPLSIAVEEISHFNTYCFYAESSRDVSALELEVQAEVDKFGLFLIWMHDRGEAENVPLLFDSIFENMRWGDWVSPKDLGRYLDAHKIAKNFCKSLMRTDLEVGEMRERLKSFFHTPPSSKLALRF